MPYQAPMQYQAACTQWQVDVAESILLHLDTVVIAGTGAGKTAPFMMPLLVEIDKILLIISPLKALQMDQVSTKYMLLYFSFT